MIAEMYKGNITTEKQYPKILIGLWP